MRRHWWNRRVQSATTVTVPPPTPETDQDARDREAATVASYGRGLRAAQLDGTHSLTDTDTDTDIHVCGVGLLPVSLVIAFADLTDARQAHTAAPDDPDAAEALKRAEDAIDADFLRQERARKDREITRDQLTI